MSFIQQTTKYLLYILLSFIIQSCSNGKDAEVNWEEAMVAMQEFVSEHKTAIDSANSTIQHIITQIDANPDICLADTNTESDYTLDFKSQIVEEGVVYHAFNHNRNAYAVNLEIFGNDSFGKDWNILNNAEVLYMLNWPTKPWKAQKFWDDKQATYFMQLDQFLLKNLLKCEHFIGLKKIAIIPPSVEGDVFSAGLYVGRAYVFDLKSGLIKDCFDVSATSSASVNYEVYNTWSDDQKKAAFEKEINRDIHAKVHDAFYRSLSERGYTLIKQ